MRNSLIRFAISIVVAFCSFTIFAHDLALLGVSDLCFSVNKDASVRLSFRFTSSAFDINRESELVITPVVEASDMLHSKSLPEVTVAGKNRVIRYQRGLKALPAGSALYPAADSNPVSYDVTVPYEKWMDNCILSFGISVRGCCGKNLKDTDVPVAEVCFDQAVFAAPVLKLNTDVKAEPKIRELQGSAFIDFRVNRTDIDLRYRRNLAELSKILSTINVVKNDPDASITDIFIKGFASPEGSYANNSRLASGRTEALKDYVKNEYHFDENIFQTSFEPEDWASLCDSIAASSFVGKTGMLEIIDSDLTPDEKDALLKRRFPADYKIILADIYPALRRSDYVVRYRIKEYSGIDEIRDVLATRPQNLNVDEFLTLLDSYTPGSRVYEEALTKGVELFPEDARVHYLKGITLAERGEYDSALPFLRAALLLGIPEADAAIASILDIRKAKDPVRYLDCPEGVSFLK